MSVFQSLKICDRMVFDVNSQVWDVLSNKEVVDIVASAASAPDCSSAAHSLVESAVRAWKYKYPTSKIDDCAVVCLFLNKNSDDAAIASINSISCNRQVGGSSFMKAADSHDSMKQQELSGPVSALDQSEIPKGKGKGKGKGGEFHKGQINPGPGNSITAGEWDEWSALEGVSRVNTLVTLPRFNVDTDGD